MSGCQHNNHNIKKDSDRIVTETSFPKKNSSKVSYEKDIQLEKDGFTYYAKCSDTEKACWIQSIKISDSKKNHIMKIPSMVEGYKVVKVGPDNRKTDIREHHWKNIYGFYVSEDEYGMTILTQKNRKKMKMIHKVVVPETVSEICPGTFAGTTGLKTLSLSPTITKIGGYAFYYCKKLKNIQLPATLLSNPAKSFDQQDCESFQIANENEKYKVKNGFLLSKDGKNIYQRVLKGTKYIIPEGVTKIPYAFFSGKKITSLSIPSTVTEIEDMALAFDNHPNIKISSDNDVYAKDGDCIYRKEDGRLIAVIERENKIFLSSKVKVVTSNFSIIGSKVKSVEYRNKNILFGDNWNNTHKLLAK